MGGMEILCFLLQLVATQECQEEHRPCVLMVMAVSTIFSQIGFGYGLQHSKTVMKHLWKTLLKP